MLKAFNFGTIGIPEGSNGIRLSITRTDGSEQAEVMYPRPEEERELANIQKADSSFTKKT